MVTIVSISILDLLATKISICYFRYFVLVSINSTFINSNARKKQKKVLKSVKNTFGFMDEVGLLHSPPSERVFGLGLLKLHHPSDLHRNIIAYKNKLQFHSEFKFADVRNQNLKLYKGFIDIFFDTKHSCFNCILLDKKALDLGTYFKNNHFKAYNSFTAKLIVESLQSGEYMAVLADDLSTPKHDNFEKETKNKVKSKARRNALYGICRLESHAVSELQMTDVLIGIVAYAFKIKYGVAGANRKSAKFRLMIHLQNKLKVAQLAKTHENKLKFGVRFKIKEFFENS